MANVAKVHIHGWMPFSIAENDEALKWLGVLNTPSHGLRISYSGEKGSGPINENGGTTTYYKFTITGEEAIWCSGVQNLTKTLEDSGCQIEEARMMDLEFDDRPTWGDVVFGEGEKIAIIPGDPMLKLLYERSAGKA